MTTAIRGLPEDFPTEPAAIEEAFDRPFSVAFPEDLRRIEAAAVNAWPTLESHEIAGWNWRSAGGGSQRANSVSTLAFEGSDVETAISAAEARYQGLGQTPIFQITSVSVPDDLDQRLAARGYRRHDPCYTMVKAVPKAPAFGVKPDLTGVEWTFHAGRQWMRIYESELDEARKATAPAIIARVPWPRAFFLYRKRGLSFATALAVHEDGMVGIECLMTREEGRRRGAARALMTGIETWAQDEGAHTLYLQVRAANVPALTLYHSLGYQIVGRSHFRKLEKPSATAGGQADAARAVASVFRTAGRRPPELAAAPLAPEAGLEQLVGKPIPALGFPSTDGHIVNLAAVPGDTVLFIYPYTGQPGVADPPGWDEIPGAHGSTPQAQGFRDLHAAFVARGIRVFGLSSQTTAWQQEVGQRLALPFPLLSDQQFQFASALSLPTFLAGEHRFYARITLLLKDGVCIRVWHPIEDPPEHAARVLAEVSSRP